MKERKKNNLMVRPPIVVVMGHIDHGKTTLLDFIRKTKIAEREAGGITQHIGAYEIEVRPEDEPKSRESETNRGIPRQMPRDDFANNRKITFIDTPGHEAFSKMRSRGARIADLAILVVAAEDGVKTQTLEAIQTIKEAKIPFIVAINKIDKEDANPDRVKSELAEREVYVESMGGKTPSVNISAKKGEGISELLEMIILVSEMEDLKADPDCPASGVVIESHLDPKRGISATLVIQNGTLRKKMFINAGGAIAPVKIFENFLGKTLEEARFSSPIKITGFNKLPEAGANFNTFTSKNDAEAGKIKEGRLSEVGLHSGSPTSLRESREHKITIPVIIKADASGSLEALQKEIMKLANEDVGLNIIRLNVGNINEDDIKLAASGKDAVIIGFSVKADNSIMQMAERLNVTLVMFDIIYKINEWLEAEIKKRLPPETNEELLGTAELVKVFNKETNKQVIGGKVLTGKIVNGKYVKIIRRGVALTKGKILELQHNRMKVSEVGENEEFGALVDIKNELAKKDLMEIYAL